MTASLDQVVDKGLAALEKDQTMMALLHFEEAASMRKTPTVLSCLGYCLAREHRQLQKGLSMGLDALRLEPNNSLHYLNLGRIYLLAGQKPLALQAFRKGLKCGRNQAIISELKRMGVRRRPVFPSLQRHHPFNRFFGLLFTRLGLR